MPPRLVYIVPANRWSGVEKYVLDLCRHFSAKGWKIDLFTRDARAVDSLFQLPGIRIRHALFGGPTDIASLFLLWRFLRRHAKADRPTIIHANRYRDALTADIARRLARKKNVRIVMTRHYVAPGKTRLPYKALYPRIDAHLFVSKCARDGFLKAWRPGRTPFDPTSLRVVHNSIFLPEEFSPAPLPDRSSATAMYHGRLAPGKGLETLIDALAILARDKVKIRLRIVGNGNPDYVDALRRRADDARVMDRIDWTRYTPDPLGLIASADFGVLPSQASEAFGIANLEYMAQGRPQVCTYNGAQPEYLSDDYDAFLVPPADAEALAEAMRKLAADSRRRFLMGGNAARTFRQKLSWNRFADTMTDIYRSLFV